MKLQTSVVSKFSNNDFKSLNVLAILIIQMTFKARLERGKQIMPILTVSALGVCPRSLQALLAIVTASLDRCIAK